MKTSHRAFWLVAATCSVAACNAIVGLRDIRESSPLGDGGASSDGGDAGADGAPLDAADPPDVTESDSGYDAGCPLPVTNTVPVAAKTLVLKQRLTRAGAAADRIDDGDPSNRASLLLSPMAVSSDGTRALATTWNGYVLEYTRDVATGRLTFNNNRFANFNQNGAYARPGGGFYTTDAYRFYAPLVRYFPAGSTSPTRAAFNLNGDDRQPTPYAPRGLVTSPAGPVYVAFGGRADATPYDSRICKLDPNLYAVTTPAADPDEVNYSQNVMPGLGAPNLDPSMAYLGLEIMIGDGHGLYWLERPTLANQTVAFAPWVSCGVGLGSRRPFTGLNGTGVIPTAMQSDPRRARLYLPYSRYDATHLKTGLAVIDTSNAAWSVKTYDNLLVGLDFARGAEVTADGRFLVVTGTTDAARNGAVWIVPLPITGTPVANIPLGTLSPGAPTLAGEYVYIPSFFEENNPTIGVYRWEP